MPLTNGVKKKIDEFDIPAKAETAAHKAEDLLKQAVAKAAELAHNNRDKVDSMLDKAHTAIDGKTEGKYSSHIAKAKEQVSKGVTKLAEQHTKAGAGTPSTASETTDAPFVEDTLTSPSVPGVPTTPSAAYPHHTTPEVKGYGSATRNGPHH